MASLPRPKQLGSALVTGIDRLVAAIGALGIGAFAWPVAIGMAVGSGLFAVLEPRFLDYALQNHSSLDFMRPVLKTIAVTTVVVTVTALGIALVRRRRTGSPALPVYVRVLRALSWLTALPLVAALRGHLMPEREWLALGFVVTSAALIAYSAYPFLPDRAVARSGRRLVRFLAPPTVVLASVGFVWKMTRLGIANHLSLNTSRNDLGIYVNLFRESSEGRLFACSLCRSGRAPYLHLEPIVALLSPLYRAHPFAETLIVLQVLAVASGSVPLFLLARAKLGDVIAAVLAFVYLAYAPLQEVTLFDFHSVALAIPVLFWIFWALERGAFRLHVGMVVALLLLREDMGLVLLVVAAYAFTLGASARRAAWTTLALAVVGLIVMHFLAPNGVGSVLSETIGEFTIGPRRTPRFAMTGDLPRAIALRVFSEGRAMNAAELLAPLLALPLLVPGRSLLLYGAVLAALSATPLQGSAHAHEMALLIPFLFILAVTALSRVASGELSFARLTGPALCRALSLGIAVSALLVCFVLGAFRDIPFQAGPRAIARRPNTQELTLSAQLRGLASSWPNGVKVAASGMLLPHFGPASHLYTLDDRSRTDYVVAFMKQRTVARRLEAEESSGQLVRIADYGDTRVYKAQYRAPLSRSQRQLDDE